MKKYTLILIVVGLTMLSYCKKAKLESKIGNSSWELTKIMIDSEDKTDTVLKNEIVYTRIEYSNSNAILYLNPTRESVEQEESGDWTLEKIVPTVGDSYYLVKNAMIYSQKRANVFNLHEYGSEVHLSEENQLTQTIGEYTVIYEKVN